MSGTATEPVAPFWFKQRQGKMEQVDDQTMFMLTAPNQQDAYIRIAQEGDKWLAAVRETVDGEDLSSTPPVFEHPGQAWEVAFELYRQAVLV